MESVGAELPPPLTQEVEEEEEEEQEEETESPLSCSLSLPPAQELTTTPADSASSARVLSFFRSNTTIYCSSPRVFSRLLLAKKKFSPAS